MRDESRRYRVPDDIGLEEAGSLTILESRRLAEDSSADLCAFELPAGCTALASWRVVARRAGSVAGAGTACWKRSQSVSNDGGVTFVIVTG